MPRERAGVQRPQMAEKERVQCDELRLDFGEDPLVNARSHDPLEHVR